MDDRSDPGPGDDDCRRVIELFLRTDAATLSLHELSTQVVSDPQRRERRRLELHHRVLPKLEEAGIVEYDWYGREVRFCGDRAKLRSVMGPADERPDPPSHPRI